MPGFETLLVGVADERGRRVDLALQDAEHRHPAELRIARDLEAMREERLVEIARDLDEVVALAQAARPAVHRARRFLDENVEQIVDAHLALGRGEEDRDHVPLGHRLDEGLPQRRQVELLAAQVLLQRVIVGLDRGLEHLTVHLGDRQDFCDLLSSRAIAK